MSGLPVWSQISKPLQPHVHSAVALLAAAVTMARLTRLAMLGHRPDRGYRGGVMGSASLAGGVAAPSRTGQRRGSLVPLRVARQSVTDPPDDYPTLPLDLPPVRDPTLIGSTFRTDIPRDAPAPAAARGVGQHDGRSAALAVVDQGPARRMGPAPLLAWRLHRWWAQAGQRRREVAGRHRPDHVSRQPWSMFAPPQRPRGRSRRHR